MKLPLNSPGLHFHVHQYSASYQTLQVKKKINFKERSNLRKDRSVTLVSKAGMFAEVTIKIKADRFSAEYSMAGK